MGKCDEAIAYLNSADKDLTAVCNMLDKDKFSLEVFGFHAQQTVEKCLKAWLSFNQMSFTKTHSIRYLLVQLEDTGENVKEYLSFIELSSFAVQYRYNSYTGLDEYFNREETILKIEQLFTHVKSLVASG